MEWVGGVCGEEGLSWVCLIKLFGLLWGFGGLCDVEGDGGKRGFNCREWFWSICGIYYVSLFVEVEGGWGEGLREWVVKGK